MRSPGAARRRRSSARLAKDCAWLSTTGYLPHPLSFMPLATPSSEPGEVVQQKKGQEPQNHDDLEEAVVEKDIGGRAGAHFHQGDLEVAQQAHDDPERGQVELIGAVPLDRFGGNGVKEV